MKKLLTIILIVFSFSTIIQAQFTSVQNGKWYWASTWSTDPNATAIPDSNDTVTLKHDVNLDGGGRCLNLIVDTGGRLHNGRVVVYGSLNNSGTINGRNEWYGMHVSLKGNLTNSGYYDADTDFHGISDQEINVADTIRLGQSYNRNSKSKIIFRNKAVISDSWLFLGNGELVFYDTLKYKRTVLDGGIINGNGSVLYGILHYENKIGWTGAVSFAPKYTVLKNLKLEGYNCLSGGGDIGDDYALSINENVINNGKIINSYLHGGGRATIHILNDFINNGEIFEQQDGIFLKIKDSYFSNNGSLTTRSLEFNGTCKFSSKDSVSLANFSGLDSNTTVTITSDEIIFKDRSVDVNFNGGKLILPSNGKLDATYMWYNKLRNIYVEANNSKIDFAHVEENAIINNGKIHYIESASNLTFKGNIEIVENGTLIAYSGSYSTVTIEGDIKNFGNVRNHYSSGNLILNITGNILHDGSQWSNSTTKLIGNEDQTISIPNDSAWTGKVILDPMLEASSYVWMKDGVEIPGATSKELVFLNGISPSDYGEYHCIVGSYNSRKIYIGNSEPTPFKITDVVITNLNTVQTKVEWKTTKPASGFIFYAEEDTTSGFPLEAMEANGNALNHSLTLDNLTTGATYYFIIDQNDADWNNVRSGTYSFVAGNTSGNGNGGTFVERIEGMKQLENTPDEENSVYYDASFISNDIAYVVTNHNRLFKTIDGGKTWTNISPEQGTDYNKIGNMPKVHFINESIGAVAFSVDDGANGYDYSKVFGYVWCTTDGGATWSQRFDVAQDQILHLKQVTETVVYVSGAASYGVSGNRWFKKIVRDTTTGNYTLSDVAAMPSTGPHCLAADWIDENVGVALGKLNYGAYTMEVFKTADGAVNWSSIQSNLPSNNNGTFSYSDQSIQMLDADNIFLAYSNKDVSGYQTKFFKSSDGGSNWVEGSFDVAPYAYPNIFFTENGNEGILSGISSDSSKVFYYTEDGGANWIHYELEGIITGQNLYASEISKDGTIWVAGSKNGIWKSSIIDTTLSAESESPSDYALLQNYPNPFNPSTKIEFSLHSSSMVSLKVYNSIGEEVAVLLNEEINAGYHSINFNATNLSSGIYFYRISAQSRNGNFIQTRKMILLK